jgi:uncharacterized protein (TIGR03437 family)
LGGVRVTVTDQVRREYAAQLIFVSPLQINFVVPPALIPGPATVKVHGPNGEVRASGLVHVEQVSPSLFAANSDGRGVAAAVAVRVKAGGSQQVEDIFECETPGGRCLPLALDTASDSDQVILLLFGTGIRWRRSLDLVRVTVGGEPAEVLYAGGQFQYAGLDQVNVLLPRGLAGRGEVEVLLIVDGKPANAVTVSVR